MIRASEFCDLVLVLLMMVEYGCSVDPLGSGIQSLRPVDVADSFVVRAPRILSAVVQTFGWPLHCFPGLSSQASVVAILPRLVVCPVVVHVRSCAFCGQHVLALRLVPSARASFFPHFPLPSVNQLVRAPSSSIS